MTNADRIRAMTDEELADWVMQIQADMYGYFDSFFARPPQLPTFKNTWLDWLKQEIDDERA